MAVILDRIFKQYGEQIVLDHFSYEFKDNKNYCVMAPSGQGKTTLLHILMGLVKADAGTVSGIDQYRIAPGFQENRLCENLSAGANIRMVTREKLQVQKLTGLMEELHLPGILRKPVRTLSGGMKRRVTIARALCSGGDLFLFDEPFKGLDVSTREAVMRVVKKAFEHKTAIWVSHDPDEAEFMESEIVTIG